MDSIACISNGLPATRSRAAQISSVNGDNSGAKRFASNIVLIMRRALSRLGT